MGWGKQAAAERTEHCTHGFMHPTLRVCDVLLVNSFYILDIPVQAQICYILERFVHWAAAFTFIMVAFEMSVGDDGLYITSTKIREGGRGKSWTE